MGHGLLLSLRRQRGGLADPSLGLSTSGPPLTPAPTANPDKKKIKKKKPSGKQSSSYHYLVGEKVLSIAADDIV